MKPVRRACILVNASKETASGAEGAIAEVLREMGVDFQIIPFSQSTPAVPEGPLDVAFCLGGDGSVLCASRALYGRGVPILPINLGHLGFLAECGMDDWRTCFESWRAGRLEPVRRMMLSVKVTRAERGVASLTALNEGTIAGTGGSKMISFNAKVSRNGDGMEDLGAYRADGLIVSTPTGSTAYSLAAGGPILPPETDAIIFNPICPFTLSNRPVVLPGHRTIRVKLPPRNRATLMLTVDGQESFPLDCGDIVDFSAGPEPALIIPSGHLSFYEVLRTKLGWSGGQDA